LHIQIISVLVTITISQFRSELPFEAICPHTTKAACIAARLSSHTLQPPGLQSAVPQASCDLIHYRPIHRAHTDSGLGHCSYLNTCYSEPTYALSPSVTPSGGSRLGTGGVNAPNANSPVSLPSGLGAGGRGKEKAPCRYLHFEVDWDEADAARAQSAAATNSAYKKMNTKKEVHKPVKLRIGQGPSGKISELVRHGEMLQKSVGLTESSDATTMDQL
jgi:mRNA (2'-O-methyladenosine-N6-)-methyltransferase